MAMEPALFVHPGCARGTGSPGHRGPGPTNVALMQQMLNISFSAQLALAHAAI
jgi:hypothetical protein